MGASLLRRRGDVHSSAYTRGRASVPLVKKVGTLESGNVVSRSTFPPFPPLYNDPLNSSRFGVPDGLPVITPAVALLVINDVIVACDASPLALLYSAATPATCGDAIDVPLIVLAP